MIRILPAKLPLNLTSYDFLKALAVFLMITDHVGYHFYPDESWFRILGRLCVPIWFFLIGYARTREIPKTMIVGIVVMTGSALVAGQYLFPLTILVTLILARYLIDGIMRRALRNHEAFAGMFFLLLLLSYPADLLFEYGTAGILFTMFGFMARHREAIRLKPLAIRLFVLGLGLTFFFGQGMMLPTVSPIQALVLFFGTFGVMFMLWRFRPLEFPRLTGILPRPFSWVLKLLGRRTLEIYVFHVVLFRAIAMTLDPERFGLFQWAVMPEGTLGFVKTIFDLQ